MDAEFAFVSLQSRKVLRKAGFSSVREVLKLNPTMLAKELDVEPKAALELQVELRGGDSHGSIPKATTAADMIRRNETLGVRHVTTCCKQFDDLLEGGFPRGALTEICGAPGSGKTQVCIQALVAATIPVEFGGLGGSSLYLDTEGSFSVKRAEDMAEAISTHLVSQVMQGEAPPPSVDQILTRIQVCRASDCGEQLAFAQSLSNYLRSNSNIKVVVIDSIAQHFRHEFPDMSVRTKLLSKHAHVLNQVASEFDVVVLVTNHMTTRGDQGLQPALGETWFHAVTNRLLLTKTDTKVVWHHPRNRDFQQQVFVRRAEVTKSSSWRCGAADFVICHTGVRKRP